MNFKCGGESALAVSRIVFLVVWVISAAAFLVGVAVSVVNYTVTKKTLKDEQSLNKSMGVSLLRTVLSVACIAVTLLVCKKLEVDLLWPGVSVAAGLTVPAILLAFLFAKK